jgi:hypothetical protein
VVGWGLVVLQSVEVVVVGWGLVVLESVVVVVVVGWVQIV